MASERSINAIIDEINQKILDSVDFDDKLNLYGLCYQQEKEGVTFPLLNIGDGQGQILHWDDKEPFRVYHRITDVVERDSDNSQGVGANPSQIDVFPMRCVFIGTRNFLTEAQYEDNQEFMRAVRGAFTFMASNKERIDFVSSEVNKPNVYLEEYEGIDLIHLSLDGIAFWIDYTISQRIC